MKPNLLTAEQLAAAASLSKELDGQVDWMAETWGMNRAERGSAIELCSRSAETIRQLLAHVTEMEKRLSDYLLARRRTIESQIASERLGGNEFKQACEKTALAEITGIEVWMAGGCKTVCDNGADRR